MDNPLAGGDSLLHRADPRVKLLLAAGLALAVALPGSFPPALGGLGAGLVLCTLARLAPLSVARRLAPAAGFLLFFWAVVPLTYPGHPVLALGWFTATHQGVRVAALVSAKSLAILLALVALLSTSSIPDLGAAMARLGVPDKLCFLFTFTYRYLDVARREYERLSRAARTRCFTPRTSLHTYRTYAYLVGMVLARSHARSLRVHQAMLLRGFSGRFVSLRAFAITPTDAVLATAGGLAVAGLAWLGIMY
jgi:cobalt/nickel transport system permease protein